MNTAKKLFTTAAMILGLGVAIELLQRLDHRREVRHAARLVDAQVIHDVQHAALTGRGAIHRLRTHVVSAVRFARVRVADVHAGCERRIAREVLTAAAEPIEIRQRRRVGSVRER
jgi:hypothetical protein